MSVQANKAAKRRYFEAFNAQDLDAVLFQDSADATIQSLQDLLYGFGAPISADPSRFGPHGADLDEGGRGGRHPAGQL